MYCIVKYKLLFIIFSNLKYLQESIAWEEKEIEKEKETRKHGKHVESNQSNCDPTKLFVQC